MRHKLQGVGPKVVTEKRVRFLARGWHIESKRGVRHIAVGKSKGNHRETGTFLSERLACRK